MQKPNMRFNRFIGDFDFNQKNIRIENQDLINQFGKVLRLNPGDQVILGNGKMEEVIAEIMAISKDFVQVKILEVRLNKNEPFKNVILYCAILKRENFELVCQKATEVGVCEIVPIICARTVKFGLKDERLKKIIKEAAEQSGRGIVPKLSQTISLEKAIEQAKNNDFNLFFDANGEVFKKNILDFRWSLSCTAIRDGNDKKECGNDKDKSSGGFVCHMKKVGVFIGPEGGWEEKEIEVARSEENFKVVSLGNLTLRAETAAIIGSYIANYIA